MAIDQPRKGSIRRMLRDLHHDMMNPLTVIVGYCQLLLGRRGLDDDVRSQIQHILDQAQECSRIMKNVTESASSSEAGDSPKTARLPNAASSRVLVIDTPAQVERIAAILREDCRVEGCNEGDEALCRLLTDDFDLILLSVRLDGGMQGSDFFRTLVVQQPEVADRVIIMSPPDPNEAEAGFLSGCARPIVSKPLNADVLRTQVVQSLP